MGNTQNAEAHVILSEDFASRSEAKPQSKDPYNLSRRDRQGKFITSPQAGRSREAACARPTQICSGSSGSGSRNGASGFSSGDGGSLIGGGIGSAGVRNRYCVGREVSTRISSCMSL
jgi:hypothetical protein